MQARDHAGRQPRASAGVGGLRYLLAVQSRPGHIHQVDDLGQTDRPAASERLASWLYGLLTGAVAGRRGYGEDSIYWHEAKGRYVGAISLGYDLTGKRIRKSVTGKANAEVRDKLKALHGELDEGTVSSPAYRVGEAVSAWLDGLKLDPSTVTNYRFMAKHVTEGLGNGRLRDLSPEDVQASWRTFRCRPVPASWSTRFCAIRSSTP